MERKVPICIDLDLEETNKCEEVLITDTSTKNSTHQSDIRMAQLPDILSNNVTSMPSTGSIPSTSNQSQNLDMFAHTFNTEDVNVLNAPASEHDPLTLDDISDFITSEIQIKDVHSEIQIKDVHSEIQVKDEPESQRSLDMASVVIPEPPPHVLGLQPVKTEAEEFITEEIRVDSDGAPIQDNDEYLLADSRPSSSSSSQGIRIAGFAVDPDSLCVLNPSKQAESTQPQSPDVVEQQRILQFTPSSENQIFHISQAQTLQTQPQQIQQTQQSQQRQQPIQIQQLLQQPIQRQQSQGHQIQPPVSQHRAAISHPNPPNAAPFSAEISKGHSTLSFPLAARQEEKIYQIYSPGLGFQYARYYIFTANDARAGTQSKEYKLMVPVNYQTLKNHVKTDGHNIRFTKIQSEAESFPGGPTQNRITLVIHFPNGIRAECAAPQTLSGFLQAVKAGTCILTWQDNITLFCSTFQGQGQLIPSFYYEKVAEFQKIEMPARINILGYEGTAVPPRNQERIQDIRLVIQQIKTGWFNNVSGQEELAQWNQEGWKRIKYMAIILEDHVYNEAVKVPHFVNSAPHRELVLKVTDFFLMMRGEYAALRKYPDIMYQVMVNQGVIGLRPSHNSLSVVTKRPNVASRGGGSTPHAPSRQTPLQPPNQSTMQPPRPQNRQQGPAAAQQPQYQAAPPPYTNRSAVNLTPRDYGEPSQVARAQTVIVNPSPPNIVATSPILNSMLESGKASPGPAATTASGPVTAFSVFTTAQKKVLSTSAPFQAENNQIILDKWVALSPEAKKMYNQQAEEINKRRTVKNSANTSGMTLVCPFHPSRCSVSNPYKDVTNLLRHLNAAHFQIILEAQLAKAQQTKKIPLDTCPEQPCGFIGPTRSDLIWHFSRCSAMTAALLKGAAVKMNLTGYNSMSHLPALRPTSVQVDPVNCAKCEVCGLTVQLQHLQCHQALTHYRKACAQELNRRRRAAGTDILKCPWIGCHTLFRSEDGREVLQIKHMLLQHISIKEILGSEIRHIPHNGILASNNKQKLSNTIRSLLTPSSTPSAPTTSSSSNNVQSFVRRKGPESRIICKTCKEEFTVFTLRGAIVSPPKVKDKKRCPDCRRNSSVKLVCRLCDKTVIDPKNPDHSKKSAPENVVGHIQSQLGQSSLSWNTHKKLVEEHMDSAEHRQREIIFNYYVTYSRIRGFDWEKDVDIRNLKFFLNVLQAKALHEKITQICCVSVMVNSLEISPSTYNTLYKHLDNLIRQKVSNFACFLCNMIFMNGKEVEEHVLTLSHSEKKAIWTSRMQDQPGPKAAILCADCDILIDDDITDKHKGHHLPDTERVPAKQIKKKKKEPAVAPVITETFIPTERMFEEDEDDPEEEDDEEVEIDDKDDDDWEMDEDGDDIEDKCEFKAVKESPSVLKSSEGFVRKEVELVGASKNKQKEGLNELKKLMDREKSERPPKRIKLEKAIKKEVIHKEVDDDVEEDYFYFCLDCEEDHGNQDGEIQTKFPLSIDLAGHINATNHQQFAPIKPTKEVVGVKLRNLSYSQEHNKTVIKKWRRLVKDGDIVDIRYSVPRKCKKCTEFFKDAVDMFKHIKDVHIEGEQAEKSV